MLDWAKKNLETVIADYRRFERKNPYGLGHKEYFVGGDQSVKFVDVYITVADFVRPVDDIAPRIGDIIHNMRVSLDYLAHAIARKRSPEIFADRQKAFQIQFPICGDPKNWPALKGKILLEEWASPEAIEDIVRCQPYSRENPANLEPLFLLHKLDNPHKHRELLSAAANVTFVDFEAIDPFGTFSVIEMRTPRPFETGSVVLRGKFTRDQSGVSRGKTEVHAKVTFEIAFDESGPAQGLGAFHILDEAADIIGNRIFPLLSKYAL
jgi:hypothetical protein